MMISRHLFHAAVAFVASACLMTIRDPMHRACQSVAAYDRFRRKMMRVGALRHTNIGDCHAGPLNFVGELTTPGVFVFHFLQPVSPSEITSI